MALGAQPADQGRGRLLGSAKVVRIGSVGTHYLRILSTLIVSRQSTATVGGALPKQKLGQFVPLEQLSALIYPKVDLCVIATDTLCHPDDANHLSATTELMVFEKPLTYFAIALKEAHWSRSKAKVAVSTPLRFMSGFGALGSALGTLDEITCTSVECKSSLPSLRPGTD
jgi:hypothetical protein